MALPGNKNALGNNGGRPREYDLVLVASKLIEWSKDDESINLNKFCATHEPPIAPTTMLRWVKESTEFREAYEIAKSSLAYRRELKLSNGELHAKAYDLNATVYDQFTRAEKIELDDMDSARKQKEIATATQQDVQRAEDIVKQLDKLQSFFSSDPPASRDTNP